MTSRTKSRPTAEQILLILLAALFVIVLLQSWNRWLDPIADTGRDLYIPEKLASGELKLYRDVSYLYPPLVPYLLAAIVGMFGSSLGVMTAVGIGLAGTTAILLFLLARRAGGVAAAGVVAFLFVTVHATGVSGYSFNFIFPYSHNAIFGFLFILVFLYALIRYSVNRGATVWLWLALMAGTAAGWSKIEFAATFLLLLAVSVLVRRPALAPIVAAAAWNLGLLAFAGWYFADAPAERHWLSENVLPQSLLAGDVARAFYARIQGLDDPGFHLGLAAAGAALTILAVLILRAIDRRMEGRGKIPAVAILLMVALIALECVLAWHFLFYRGWVILQLLLIPWAVRRRRESPLLLLLVFSLFLGSRILLRLEPTWYGFLFSIPAEVVLAVVLFRELPEAGLYRSRAALLWLPLFLLVGGSSLLHQRDVYTGITSDPVSTSRGAFIDRSPDRASILIEIHDILQKEPPESLLVIPEGLALNWLFEIPTSIPYHTFNPAELPDEASQQRVIGAIRRDPPEMVLLLRRDFGEFGLTSIGVDFGQNLMAEVQCLYQPVVYRERARFYALLMERKAERSCP